MNKRVASLLIFLSFTTGAVSIWLATQQPWSEPVPRFVFNQQLANEWWSGGNTNSRELWVKDDGQGPSTPVDKLPIAGMNVLHGSAGSPAPDKCFLMYSYYDYRLNSLAAAYTDYENRKVFDKTTDNFKHIDTKSVEISTFEGVKRIRVRQYDFSSESNQHILHGYQIGFTEMKDGYMRLEGVCKSSDDLDKSIEAAQSVRLVK